ncbi:MAG: HNH endonuclease, partial [Acidimicrobiia bacterium]|nr:HNH endonuclease [Acidimicrobiia bacterium]
EHLNAGAVCSLIDSGNGTKGRPSIHVICDLDTLTGRVWDRTIKHTGAGNTLPLSTLRQFLCDAWITHTVLGPSGKALAVGRSHRTATDTQRTALRVMYPTCALCDVRFDHCEMHHIIEWEHGGATDLANLIPLCTIHHDRVHHGWRIELNQDRLLRVYRPDGQTWRTIPLPSAQPAQARNHTRKRQQHHEHHRHRTRSTTE